MTKELLNEAERFLLEHWGEARLVEESMKGVRTKYEELFQRIIDEVAQRNPKLNANDFNLTQSWGSGLLWFGQKSWPCDSYEQPAGLWMKSLRLDVLTDEDADHPSAYIWAPKKAKLDFTLARKAMWEEANRILTPEGLNCTEGAGSDGVLLYVPAPSRDELRRAFCQGDGEAFVARIVAQFDMMARFVPVLDQVFRECVRKE